MFQDRISIKRFTFDPLSTLIHSSFPFFELNRSVSLIDLSFIRFVLLYNLFTLRMQGLGFLHHVLINRVSKVRALHPVIQYSTGPEQFARLETD